MTPNLHSPLPDLRPGRYSFPGSDRLKPFRHKKCALLVGRIFYALITHFLFVSFRSASTWVRCSWVGIPGLPPTLMRNLPRPGLAALPVPVHDPGSAQETRRSFSAFDSGTAAVSLSISARGSTPAKTMPARSTKPRAFIRSCSVGKLLRNLHRRSPPALVMARISIALDSMRCRRRLHRLPALQL